MFLEISTLACIRAKCHILANCSNRPQDLSFSAWHILPTVVDNKQLLAAAAAAALLGRGILIPEKGWWSLEASLKTS